MPRGFGRPDIFFSDTSLASTRVTELLVADVTYSIITARSNALRNLFPLRSFVSFDFLFSVAFSPCGGSYAACHSSVINYREHSPRRMRRGVLEQRLMAEMPVARNNIPDATIHLALGCSIAPRRALEGGEETGILSHCFVGVAANPVPESSPGCKRRQTERRKYAGERSALAGISATCSDV